MLHLSAFDRRIKAAVAQVPAISGWRSIMKNAERQAVHAALALALADRKNRYQSGETGYLPVVEPEGQPALLATAESYAFFAEDCRDRAP